jgi:hypothetical protein
MCRLPLALSPCALAHGYQSPSAALYLATQISRRVSTYGTVSMVTQTDKRLRGCLVGGNTEGQPALSQAVTLHHSSSTASVGVAATGASRTQPLLDLADQFIDVLAAL